MLKVEAEIRKGNIHCGYMAYKSDEYDKEPENYVEKRG